MVGHKGQANGLCQGIDRLKVANAAAGIGFLQPAIKACVALGCEGALVLVGAIEEQMSAGVERCIHALEERLHEAPRDDMKTVACINGIVAVLKQLVLCGPRDCGDVQRLREQKVLWLAFHLEACGDARQVVGKVGWLPCVVGKGLCKMQGVLAGAAGHLQYTRLSWQMAHELFQDEALVVVGSLIERQHVGLRWFKAEWTARPEQGPECHRQTGELSALS